MQNNTKAQDVGALWNIIYMHLHVVFTYQPTFYSQIFSQHIFRLNFQTYCIRSTQDSEPVKYAKKYPIINQSENKMPTSSQSHVTDLISFLTHIWHEQLEWFHYLQYLCQDRCFRQPWTKMENVSQMEDHVSQMGETEIKWQSWAELVPWTLWKLTFNFPFHSKRFRPFRAIFIDKKQFFGQQPCDISKVWRALKTPIWTLVPIYQVHGSGDLFARHMALRPVQGLWSLDRSPHCNLNTNNDCRPLCREKCLRVTLHKRSSEMFCILQWKIFSSNPLANVSVNAKAWGQEEFVN